MDKDVLLEKYLHGTLTNEEQKDFDALLKSDSGFREQVSYEEDVKKAITEEEESTFHALLSEFEKELLTDKQKTRFPKMWLIAASIVLVFGLSFLFFPESSNQSQDLFEANFTPYRNVVHPINRSDDILDEKSKAFIAYSKKDYETAIPIFERLYQQESTPYYLFYQGNALLAVDRAEEAIPIFQGYIETKGELSPKAKWYLALAFLDVGDLENAKKALNEVLKANDYKSSEAKQLLEAL